MKKLTEFGKRLRFLRLEKDELLKDMAGKLGFSAAFLSAIEYGNKMPPKNFIERLCQIYELGQNEKEALEDALSLTLNKAEIDLEDISDMQKQLGITFARRFQALSDEEIKEVLKILEKGN